MILLFYLLLFCSISSVRCGQGSPLDQESIFDRPPVKQEEDFDIIPKGIRTETQNQRSETGNTNAALGGCAGHCARHFMETLNGVLEGSTVKLFKNFNDTCRRYTEAKDCMQKKYYCQVTSFFDSISSGLQYLCEYQRKAMDALMPCVQENVASVRESCDYSCQPHALATGLTVKQFLEKDFSFFKLFDKHIGTLTTNEACRVGKCLLKCYRTKLNLRCQGMAGSLLTEGIVRPFADIQRQSTAFAGMFQMIMPRQCSFLNNENELNELKIDPMLDEHIRVLHEGVRPTADMAKTSQNVSIPHPEVYEDREKSPLDDN